MTIICHIIPHGVWERVQTQSHYEGDTLRSEGFIHFSTPDQVVRVADARFQGHTGLLLLLVDTDRLTEELRFEPPYENMPGVATQTTDGELFPHLYGPLNLDAVIRAVPFEPNADGFFSLPEDTAN